jgi:hypothetical protein
MLTKLRMSVEEAISELDIIVEKVYTNKLEPAEKTKELRNCIEGLLSKRNLPVDLELRPGSYEGWYLRGWGYAFLFPTLQEINEPADFF